MDWCWLREQLRLHPAEVTLPSPLNAPEETPTAHGVVELWDDRIATWHGEIPSHLQCILFILYSMYFTIASVSITSWKSRAVLLKRSQRLKSIEVMTFQPRSGCRSFCTLAILLETAQIWRQGCIKFPQKGLQLVFFCSVYHFSPTAKLWYGWGL